MHTCKTNLIILKDLATNSTLHIILLEKNDPIVYILFSGIFYTKQRFQPFLIRFYILFSP